MYNYACILQSRIADVANKTSSCFIVSLFSPLAFNVTMRLFATFITAHEAQTFAIFSCRKLYTRLSLSRARGEIREIIPRFKRAVPSCGIISRYHACVTRSQMEDMKLHGGGLPGEYTSVQRIFRAVVLRLRVLVNLYAVSDPVQAAPIPRTLVSSRRFVIIHGTAKSSTFLVNFAAGKSDSCATHFRSSQLTI